MINIEMSFLRIILCILSCYRISELISIDDGPFKLFYNLRRLIAVNSTRNIFLREISLLIHCPFCIGFWISLLLSFTVFFPSSFGDIFLVVFSVSGGQTFLESISRRFLDKD